MDKFTTVLKDLENLAEPAFKEYKTTKYILNFLNDIGIKDITKLETGCFGTLNFNSQKTIALRADIDALPINQDKTECRHLCGHHFHTATLLLTLQKIITENISLPFNLRFIFQPAEEIVSGARKMVEAGALRGVSEIFGLHVDPEIEFGTIGIKYGKMMAGSNHFSIVFHGKSTHGAYPHLGNDLIVASADFINMAQKVVSRKIDPLKENLITFGKIIGGTAGNILPSSLLIEGTFRYFEKELKDFLINELIKCAKAIETFYDIKIEIKVKEGTPPVINDEKLTSKIEELCKRLKIPYTIDLPKTMGGEDFAIYQETVPGIFLRFGIKKGEKIIPLHNINFKVPEEAVTYAVDFWMKFLKNYEID